jgi:hypothetical protein
MTHAWRPELQPNALDNDNSQVLRVTSLETESHVRQTVSKAHRAGDVAQDAYVLRILKVQSIQQPTKTYKTNKNNKVEMI